jgi:predicted DNA-binding transcriptional regulator YafY
MKSSRLLSMLLLLQGAERRSARELAAVLEVSARTVYRDVDALAASGVPVYAERGVYGGIALAAGYRKALTQFGEDDIRALFISGANPLGDLGLGAGRERALEKLAGAMSDAQRKAVTKTRGRIHIDQRRWNQPAQPHEHLAALRLAVWDERRVQLRYRDRESKTTERTVDPLGLVAKAGVWYLVARAGAEFRTFRAERITGVKTLAESFARPAGFDLDAYWQNWTSTIEADSKRIPVVFAVAPSELERISQYWETQVLTPPGDSPADTVLVRVIFPAVDVALHQAAAWAGIAELVEPPALRAELVKCAHAILAAHARPTARS